MSGLFNDPTPPRPAAAPSAARGPNPEWPYTTKPAKPATIATEPLLGATGGAADTNGGGLTRPTQSKGMLKPAKTLGWG